MNFSGLFTELFGNVFADGTFAKITFSECEGIGAEIGSFIKAFHGGFGDNYLNFTSISRV